MAKILAICATVLVILGDYDTDSGRTKLLIGALFLLTGCVMEGFDRLAGKGKP